MFLMALEWKLKWFQEISTETNFQVEAEAVHGLCFDTIDCYYRTINYIYFQALRTKQR